LIHYSCEVDRRTVSLYSFVDAHVNEDHLDPAYDERPM